MTKGPKHFDLENPPDLNISYRINKMLDANRSQRDLERHRVTFLEVREEEKKRKGEKKQFIWN